MTTRSRPVPILLVLLLAAPPAARSAEETLNPFHVARLRSVTAVAAASDGSKVAYVLAVPRTPLRDEDGPAWAELRVVDHQGQSRPFVTGEVNVEALAWTPDGAGISFLAKRGKDEQKALYVIPIDGGEARRVVAHAEDITAFSWSPDGSRVAFLATSEKPKEEKDLEKKGFNQQIYEEDARPVRVWVVAADDPDARPQALDLEGSASELHWAPSGTSLAVALAPTPGVDDSYTSRKVHVVDADSGAVVARFDNPGKLGKVAWSPDGDHLAYLSAADPNDPHPGRLMVAPAGGGTPRDLLPGLEADAADFAWRDDQTLSVLIDEGTETSLSTVRADGSDRTTTLQAGLDVFTALDRAGDSGALALIGESPRHPSEVFLADGAGGDPRRLTTSNPWLDAMRLATQEVVAFRARDGLDLQGILIRPLNAEPDAPSPLILAVHGGPESHLRNGWLTSYSNPGQMAAARGYAVFYPNYRGSTGRGVAFSKLGQKDPAGKEFDDLVDAVDHLVADGVADRARVGITGGSYGGYASAWGATYYSDRFAAAVMFVGISDKTSKSGTTDIPREEFLVHARRRPWEDWSFFLERSPIRHIEKSHTPILILHGKDDPRVHPSQSLELYRYLKLMDRAPVRLILYPGEGHGNRRAASRLDYSLRMLGWFDHYLQGDGGDPPPSRIDYQEPSSRDATSEMNEPFRQPDVSRFVTRFEDEDREVFARREAIADALGLSPGMSVADIGAGTGFFALLFAQRVGPEGGVFAVDIAPEFLRHVASRAREQGLDNVATVLGSQDRTNLPPGAIDLAFTSDTYHHFEHPEKVLASIRSALKPGGRLVVVDFDRREGTSPAFVLEHVRADKATFFEEIEAAGFERIPIAVDPELKDNFIAQFRRVGGPAPK